MTRTKLALVFILLTLTAMMFAAPITITFRDTSTATRTLIWAEDPNYPQPTPTDGTYDRWQYRIYKTADDVISPLDANGNPTGDDVLATNYILQGYTGNSGNVNLGPTGGVTFNAPALVCPDPGADPTVIYHTSGHKVFIRIFNNFNPAMATKSIVWSTTYTILSANLTVSIPGWNAAGWVQHATVVTNPPNPAVLLMPANGATIDYATGTNLTWEAAGTGGAPTGYKVYFGAGAPSVDPVYTGPNTTYPTGVLLPSTTYYWKVVAYNADGDADPSETRSFTTTAAPVYYDVVVTSDPAGHPIHVDGVASGHVTPWTFSMLEGTSATYTVVNPAYNWVPTEFVVTAIDENKSVNFIGTLKTFTVYLTSEPTDAEIWAEGSYTGHNTPWTFTLNYGDDQTYSVQKEGYHDWEPAELEITNIMAPVSQHFVGQIINFPVEITSDPTGATILVNGARGQMRDGRFVTPHTFTMSYGSSATYTVQKEGYHNWTPTELEVTNIMAPVLQHFVGQQITYQYYIDSEPQGAAIYIDSNPIGQVTPYAYFMNYGSSATISVSLPQYTWNPPSHTVTNIMADGSIFFTGTFVPNMFDVLVTSTPAGADIYVDGQASGLITPHTFQWEQGTSADITLYLPQHTWEPPVWSITNLSANVSQHFVGTYVPFYYDVAVTSTPPGADIYVGGVDSGFNTPHTFNWVEGTNAEITVELPQYTWMPASWTITNLSANMSQNFVGTYVPMYYDVLVTSTPPGADIYVGGVDSGFNTPHTFNWVEGTNAEITVELPQYTWMPASWSITNLSANMSQNFVGTYVPFYYDVAVTSTPPGAAIYVGGVDSGFNTPYTFNWVEGTNAVITVVLPQYTWMPASWSISNLSANMSQNFVGTYVPMYYNVQITSNPTGAAIWVDGLDSGFITPYTFSMLENTSATYVVQKDGYYNWMPAQFVVTNIMADMSQHFVGTAIPTINLTYPQDEAVLNLYGNVRLRWNAQNLPVGYWFQLFLAPVNPPTIVVYTGTNNYYDTGELLPNTRYYWFVRVWYPTKDAYVDSEVQYFDSGDYFLPIELSSFTATVTSQLFVNLTWVTQSETQVMGYNLYRASSNVPETSVKVNRSIIPAVNSSTQQSYTFIDDTEGLSANNTYYYWLENVDMNGMSNMHGPVNVTLTGTVIPPLPELSVLKNAYPNPFRVGEATTISVSIKEGETGVVTVYNLLGQVIKTYRVGAGDHNLKWDAKGNASGIYFYKLSTPSTNATKKLVIVN